MLYNNVRHEQSVVSDSDIGTTSVPLRCAYWLAVDFSTVRVLQHLHRSFIETIGFVEAS